MQMCVGAVSIRVIEEAAKFHMPIIASRRQVDVGGGYTGLDQVELVTLVRKHSRTSAVIRDHGGPNQGYGGDDGIDSFDADVEAGFDTLHLDVSQVDDLNGQVQALDSLVSRYHDRIALEVGGERDDFSHNDVLVGTAAKYDLMSPLTVVIDTGAHAWSDRQIGRLQSVENVNRWCAFYASRGHLTKAHNFDWLGRRQRASYGLLDFYNLAPELAQVEIDALLHVLPWKAADRLLELAYDSREWTRWFHDDEGTWDERARCAARYVLALPEVDDVIEYEFDSDQEEWVRGRIRQALVAG